ncbi:MAG: hypothetical protein V1924_00870 [Candidatus Bathyarchaeota archaeon]
MTHYEARRHRLAAHEVPLVHALILEKLAELYEERRDLGGAEELYRVVHRMDHYRVGPPAYPSPFTWSILEAYLENSVESAESRDNGPLEESPECPCPEASRESCTRCQDLPVWWFDNPEEVRP